ncbi:MAG: acireductone synthase [bacterium]|jgi:enolase-phosphatase E1
MTKPVIILDIEGTTTPVAFVTDILFPYAVQHAPAYLRREEADSASIDLLWEEFQQEAILKTQWESRDDRKGLIAYVEALIRADVKSVGLKRLQGILWEAGYRDGTIKGDIYPDVPPALDRWNKAGYRVVIYSSGSVQAQKLLFGHTAYGDLTPYLYAHFDATIGGKKEAESYRKIAAALSVSPEHCIFFTDALAEADAAHEAGMQTRFMVRPGNPAMDQGSHLKLTTFDSVNFS